MHLLPFALYKDAHCFIHNFIARERGYGCLNLFVLMCTELCSTEHGAIAHQAMVMSLFHAVDTFGATIFAISFHVLVAVGLRIGAWFVVCHLTETDCPNILQFAVMTSMGHNFIRIRANEIALQAVEM